MPQIEDINVFTKGMNKDVDPRFLGDGQYVDALNVMTSNYQDGAANSLTNFPSIHRLSTLGYTILGMFKDEKNDKLYIFASNGTTGAIYGYTLQTDALATIVTTTVFPWTTSTIIKACRIVEGIIIWTDGTNDVGMYDQNVTYGTITANMLTLAQVTPLTEPTISLLADTNFKSNNIVGKFFQFKYRFVFKNKMRSVFSPISNVAFSSDDYSAPSDLAGVANMVNAVDISMSGANSNGLVESIEVAARSGNDGDFFMIKEIDANATFLAGGLQLYRFFNEGLYSPIDLQESNQIMDDVPMTAATLEMANNRVVLGNCKNGYDDVAVDYDIDVLYNDAVNPSEAVFDSADSGLLADATYISDFGGTPTPRAVLSSGVMLGSFFRYFGYTTLLAGDTISVAGVEIPNPSGYSPDPEHPYGYVSLQVDYGETWNTLFARIMAFEFYEPESGRSDLDFMDIATPPIPPTGNDKFQMRLTQGAHSNTFKTGAWYNIGLQYQDLYGRTNGVQIQEESKVYIKTLAERGLTPNTYTGAGAATIQVTINNSMPSWAASVKVVYSRASVYDQSVQVATRGSHVDTHVWVDIGSIVEWNESEGGNIAYQWERGDRIRILTEHHATYPLTNWAQSLREAEIVNSDSAKSGSVTGGYNIAIPALSGLSASATSAILETSIIEIFRPSRELEASKSIYTEANYVEGSSTIISGDAYMKSRSNFPYGGASATANIAFEGYDISDFSDSEQYDKGRATAIINQEESQRIATLMYSEVIIPNTEINKLNRFYPDVNFEVYNKTFGPIVHLYNEGDHLLMLQEDKVSKVFIDRSLTYDGSGKSTVLNTQATVLSEAVPYSGVYGLQDYGSFTAIGNRRYWLDMSRGVVIRLGNNGIEEISRYGMRGWFSNMCRTRMEAGALNTYGAYDVQNDMYTIYFGTGNAVVFDEKNNGWMTFTDIITPKFSTYINNRSFVIDSNYLWEMNYSGFKNTKHISGAEAISDSTVKFPSNVEPTTLKNYLAIHLDSTHAMAVSIATDALNGRTAQASSLVVGDFTEREQEYHASFLRDVNTPKLDPVMSDPNWTDRAIFLGDTIKGKHAQIELTLATSDDLLIRMVKVLVSKG